MAPHCVVISRFSLLLSSLFLTAVASFQLVVPRLSYDHQRLATLPALDASVASDGEASARRPLVLLLPSTDSPSPFGGNLSFHDAGERLVERLRDRYPGVAAVRVPELEEEDVLTACLSAGAVIAIGLSSPLDVRCAAVLFRRRRTDPIGGDGSGPVCQFALGGKPFAPLVGPYDEANPSWEELLPWTEAAEGKRVAAEMEALFEKWDLDDFGVAVSLFLDRDW